MSAPVSSSSSTWWQSFQAQQNTTSPTTATNSTTTPAGGQHHHHGGHGNKLQELEAQYAALSPQQQQGPQGQALQQQISAIEQKIASHKGGGGAGPGAVTTTLPAGSGAQLNIVG